MSVILPQIPARLRRVLGRFVGPAGAALFSLVLASCAGGGFGGAPDAPAVNPASQPAPAASGPISPASQRNVAEALSGLKLGDETPPISPEDIAVSDDAEILNRNPFSSSAPAARASGWGARADSTRKTQGYKAFEVAVPSENPLMTVAVWISETPPDYPEGKPEQDPEADRKFLYLRLQVFIAVGHVALVEGGGIEVLDSQVIVVEEKRPDPKPQPVTLEAVTAETVCESGSLSANGLTQTELDEGLLSAAKANDLAKVCEHLRRGADMNARDRFHAPDGLHRRTPLMLAAVDNRLNLAKLLVGNGASVNYQSGGPDLERQDGAGWSALMYAAGAGQVETATYLLDQGAEINMQWASGYSSLHEAAIWGRYETVELLIARGANVNVRDYGVGETPLHGASWGGSRGHFTSTRPSSRVSWEKVIKALLDGGADVNARVDLDNPSGSRAGRSPLDTVALHYMSRRAAKLRDAGGYCYVQTSSLCAYPPVVTAVTLAVTAETVCESGSLSANGLTQAQLDAGLLSAAKANDLAKVCEHLRRGADMNARDRFHAPDGLHRRTPLMLAAVDNRLELAKLLVGNGASVNYQSGGPDLERQDGAGWSALMYAAGAGQVETATYLLDQGAEINMQWASGYSSLHEAAIWGRYETVELLIARGANVNVRDYGVGETPLHGASWGGSRGHFTSTRPSSRVSWEKVIKALLDGGADVNARVDLDNPSGSRAGRSPLDTVALHYMSRRAAKLRDAGGYCYVQTSSLCAYPPVVTAVTLAVTSETVCESGSLSANGLTQAQLDAGLLSAAKANDLAKVCEHLRRGADMNARDRFHAPDGLHRRTPLMLAAVDNRLELAKLLVGNGASVNYQSGGPDLERQDGAGWSALMYAAGAGQVETATYLLDQGAEINMQWASGYSSLHEAAIWGRYETVELLIARGANVNVRDYGVGETPLHGASWGGSRGHFTSTRPSSRVSWEKVIKALLDGGADVNARVDLDNPSGSRAGRSPLDTVALHYMSRRAAKLRDAGGYCYVQTSSLCAYPPVVTAVTLAVTAETVCESGSLSANGLTQAQLDAGLISAAKANNLTSACEYLRRGASPDSRESRGVFNRTALMIAASDGRLDLAKLLHGNGADVNLQKGQMNHWAYDSPGWSALIYAATAGHADLVSWLLDSGADIEAHWSEGKKTALWEAAHWGRAEVVEMLLSRGVNPDRSDGHLPLHGGADKLFGGVATPSRSVMVGYSRMGEDAQVKVVSLLAAAVSDVNALENGRTALDVAVSVNYAKVAAVLRNAGGKCVVEAGPLCPVVEVATAETVTVTADALECPAGTLPTNGLTAAELNMTLRMAARGGDATRVCEALKRGAEVNDNLDDSEFTPLQEAVSGGHLEAAKVLLANGAEVNKRKDGAGHSPLDLAARDGEAEIAALLRNADGRCFVETGPLCQSVPVATPDPVTVVNTVAATVASTVVATVANTVIAAVENTVASTVAAGACPTGTLPTNGMTQAQLDAGLLSAASSGDLAEACEHLRRGANPNGRDQYEHVPLMRASSQADLEMGKLLLDNGADLTVVWVTGGRWTPLFAQYNGGYASARLAAQIEFYLSRGVDPNLGSSAWNPLHEAAYYNEWRSIKLLLDAGADPNIQTTRSGWRGGAPLHYVFDGTRSGSALAVSVLVAGDADVNLRDNRGRSALDLAANRGDAASAEILRAAGGQCFVSTRSLCGTVPVATPDPVTVVNTVAATVVATVANTVVAAVENTVASTVAAGSCPAGTLDANGMTQAQLDAGLLSAASSGDLAEACEHLRRGANPNGRDQYEHVPLMRARAQADLEMGKLLLDNGADLTVWVTGGRWTPLFVQYNGGYTSARLAAQIEFYLSRGVDPNFGSSAWNPLHEAAYYNEWRSMKLLLDAGADPNIQTTRSGWRGGAPLHYVFDGTRSGSALAVSVLVAGDADVNLRDSGGNSALDLAARGGDAASAEILRAAGGQCFVSTSSLCGSAPAPAAAAAESAPATDRLRESFAGAFNPSPAFGDAFGAASGSSERFLSRLDSLMRSTSGSGGDAWDSFAGWQRENEHGRMWFSTGQRGDFGFGAGVGGAGGDLSASPFAAMVGNGMLAGGETGLGAAGKLRIAAFADYQARSLLDGTDRQWTKWAASGTAIETAMTEVERFSGLAENQTRGAMTEIHLGGGGLGVALQAGAVSESDAMLSGTADDEHLRGLRARTAFAGLSGAADLFGSGWRLRGSAHLGRSWAESERMLRDGDLWASAFSAGLERGGWLYSDDGFILRFSQPLRVESLEMDLIGADGASRLGADPSGRQLDVDAAYRLPLSGGGWLLLSAGVRRDGGHTSSSDLEAGALFSVERGF